jgi:RTX calcium-binding nonapeptide repeat (4 copies)
MENFMRLHDSRAVRPVLLVVSALAVAAAVGGTAGTAAGQGTAPAHHAHKASLLRTEAQFRDPQLQSGELAIQGTNANDRLALRLQAGNPAVLQVDVGDDGSADFSFARAGIARISVDGGNGDDVVRIDEGNGVFTDTIATTIDGGNGEDSLSGGSGAVTLQGGNGDDILAGGSGAETLEGGNGNDSIDGNGGNDVGLLGNGDDTFVWDPGDGSDVVEGQNGIDTMLFNGANGAEQVDLSANGERLRFFRTQGTITMDTDGVETVDFNALGGADLVTVNDLSGTDVSNVNVDLAGVLGGATGDGAADRVLLNATNGNHTIRVNGDAGAVKVSGLPATVNVLHPELANDRLEINTLGGGNKVDAGGLAAGAIQLFVNGVAHP